MAVLGILLAICITVTLQYGETATTNWFIAPKGSSSECQNYTTGTCSTLQQLYTHLKGNKHTSITLTFLPGDHLLTWKMSFSKAKEVILKSEQKRHPRIICSQGKGWIEVNETEMFAVEGLHIHGCKELGAIHLTHTTAAILRTIFTNNTAEFGGALKALKSQVHITNSTFQGNSAAQDGGAIYSVNANLTISGCSFRNNSAQRVGGAIAIFPGVRNNLHLNSLNNTYISNRASKGGAVRSGTVTLLFQGDTFNENQADIQGAALHILSLVPMTIQRCYFEWNHVKHSKAAVVYASRIKLYLKKNSWLHNKGSALYLVFAKVFFCNGTSQFSNNNGGAIVSVASTITVEEDSRILIKKNRATNGGGIYLEQSTISIKSNEVDIVANYAEESGGGIYAFQSTLNIRSHVKVTHNVASESGGGMFLSDTTISISGTGKSVYFIDNRAHQFGGGIFLESASNIRIKDRVLYSKTLNLSFIGNSAKRGGGIYVKDRGTRLCKRMFSNPCFLQTWVFFPNNKKPIIQFANNTAEHTGSDIYGGLLDRCFSSISEYFVRKHSGIEYIQKKVKFDWANNKEVTDRRDFYGHVSSDPVRICRCMNGTIDCNNAHPPVFAKKGERFTLNLIALDQVGKPVRATIFSSLKLVNSGIGGLGKGQYSREIGNHCTELEYNVYSAWRKEVLKVYADGPCQDKGISKHDINLTFKQCTCPIGFEIDKTSMINCSCKCDKKLSTIVSSCYPKDETIELKSNVWIEYVNFTNITDYVIHACPFDYCVEKPVNISLTDQDEQCAFNRTGTLCGECEQELSLVFTSSQCQQCSNYYLFLLLPFALAGIALVAFILVLNMTVAKGTIHGLIFYANILAANQPIFLPFNEQNILTVFISWLSLDLGIKTCFYPGMDSYGKLMLQLVFPMYVFLLIATIMILCDHSQRIARLFGKRNPEATLYTLVLLSYSKLIRLIVTALQFTTISYPDGTQERVWLYDANVLYFTASHTPRFIAAIIIILLGSIYIALLLFGQLFNRCSEHRLMKWTTHKYYIHFMKAHHAPFSDNHRYWVGLLLLVRLAHILTTAFANDTVVILFVVTLSSALLLTKSTSKTIYSKHAVCFLETTFLVNLGLLASSSLYIRLVDSIEHQSTLTTVSMSVTFIAFLVVVLYHILETCPVKPHRLLRRAHGAFRKHSRHECLSDVDREELPSNDNDNGQRAPSKQLITLAEVQNDTETNVTDCYISSPIIRRAGPNDQLREPALDILIPVQPEDYNTH